MARRKNDGDDDGGLDSLLDTMTNVVGILVLVLIVTQMSVADVVTRITSENQIDEETVQELSEQLVSKKEEQDDLERMLVDPASIDAEKQLADLERKKELLERRRKLLEQKQKEKNEFAIKITKDREQAKQNRKEIADTKKKRDELQSFLAESLEKRAALKAKLARTPKVDVPADIEISIPNPRPPPKGAKQTVFICKGEEIYPLLSLELFRKQAEQQAKEIILRRKLALAPQAGIDPEKFGKYWTRLKNKDEFFDVEYFVWKDRWPRLRFTVRDTKGANESELKNPRSRVRSAQWIGALNPQEHYARFFVQPDGFGIYVVARRLFSDAGMLAGWQPQADNWQYTSYVPGGIELGPPVPDEPKPERKPQNLID